MSNSKITVVETSLSRTAFEELSGKEKLKLNETAQDLLSFLNEFAMLHKIKSTMTTAVSSSLTFTIIYLVQTMMTRYKIMKIFQKALLR